MSYIIVGLGNPGEEYDGSRHNAGRAIAKKFAESSQLSEFKYDKKTNALVSKGKIGKTPVVVMLPEGFMNNSGASVKPLITSVKPARTAKTGGKAEQLVVVHDDLDLPFGRIKLSFNRSAGGHRGVSSIVKNIKTEQFLRIRIGVCPTTPSGKLKKPTGEDEVVDFILKPFKKTEELELKKIIKKAAEALASVVEEGRERAMNIYNS
jgi:PTH1 family peptidyl-tRNA hydrolase